MIAICSARPAGDDDYAEYEEVEPAPPPKPTPRTNPLLNRRNPLNRNPPAKSTTTTPPPVEEEEVAEEEEEIVEEVPAEPSSTTEPPRKLKGGILRPFRSNDDLLAALKRRREQAAATKPGGSKHIQASESNDSEPLVEPTPKPSKATTSRRRFNSKVDSNNNAESEQGSTSAPIRTGRRFRS
ncbi:hypothetical protein MML48_3g00008863 [Holotrichia oblita]|uniref:Uncharacterized protein n=3 Tax=Holotrichia oblita TaxID=644536 RepID=A0ACB9THK0_HOLOL|nr:hypothetical protein MML48_3g00001003 [Holotrichia oblita]KAI4466284.1 hypothetical protein MML48_3g00004329 [Holotrichia oblita]KAI4466291.1 hypothetical protein MML48_3g00008863 [Holotrichia oblita]